MLKGEGHSDAEQQRIVEALTSESLSPKALDEREHAVLQYADKLTRDPGSMSSSDVDRLRAAGMEDLAIHDVCSIVAYFAFVNRVADGLGVELEQR